MTATLTVLAGALAGWRFDDELENDGTQVAATHLATGVVTIHDTQSDAREFAARTDVLTCLAAQTIGTIDGIATSADQADAHTALAKLLDLGALLPPMVEAEHRCRCGGYLATRERRLTHIDTCADEIAGLICDEDDHKTCQRPTAVQCEHPACRNRNQAHVEACLYGHEFCCGCCHGATD